MNTDISKEYHIFRIFNDNLEEITNGGKRVEALNTRMGARVRFNTQVWGQLLYLSPGDYKCRQSDKSMNRIGGLKKGGIARSSSYILYY